MAKNTKPSQPKLPAKKSPVSPLPSVSPKTRSAGGAQSSAAEKKRSLGRRGMAQASLAADLDPMVHKAEVESLLNLDDARALPRISAVAGEALQRAIQDVNKATIALLKTAARLDTVEPLAPMLIGASADLIALFDKPAHGERLLAQSMGFPLVQMRILDVGIMRQMLSDGAVSTATVMALTKTFPLDVIEAAAPRTAKRSGG